MPRETKHAKQVRLTRSGRSDPLWETIILLQERGRYLERRIRSGERSRLELEAEIRSLQQEVERLSSRVSFSVRERELELENQNLHRQLVRLRQLLFQLGIPVTASLDRTYSSRDFL